MEEKAQPFGNIWNMTKDVVEKNNEIRKAVHSDMPDEDKVATDINGYVINNVGNIVAQFGFFMAEDENPETIQLQISADGFLARIYNEPTNIILGYGHPTGFTGLIDPKFSQVLHLGPDAANGEFIIVSIPNDETLREKGVNFIIRDVDVVLDLLSEDVKEDFIQSLEDAKDQIEDMNDMETAYNNYMKHIYTLLGEHNTKDEELIKEEFYE